MHIELPLEKINEFLKCPTPSEWLDEAKKPERLPVLLQDHLLCELNDNMCSC